VCSLTLGAIVILNAQFGCDSPASTAPPPAEPAAKTEPAANSVATPEPTTPEPTTPEPTTPEPTTPEPTKTEPNVKPAANAAPEEIVEPVYMPASKSGGDFGRMQFPGQANPAPQPQQVQQK
jgi:cytoskeletal protein RodZ